MAEENKTVDESVKKNSGNDGELSEEEKIAKEFEEQIKSFHNDLYKFYNLELSSINSPLVFEEPVPNVVPNEVGNVTKTKSRRLFENLALKAYRDYISIKKSEGVDNNANSKREGKGDQNSELESKFHDYLKRHCNASNRFSECETSPSRNTPGSSGGGG
jgi:hypothetical protein